MNPEEDKIIAGVPNFMKDVLGRTFECLRSAYSKEDRYTSEGTRLIFPKYSRESSKNTELRVSEQELRFVFVEKFVEYCNASHEELYYSVETPTTDSYLFSEGKTYKSLMEKGEKIELPCIHSEGVSGKFDMTIYNKDNNGEYNTVCLIEFKAGSISEQDFKEVLVKLANPKEKAPSRYIIHMVKDKASDNTIENMMAAIKWLYEESDIKGNSKRIEQVLIPLTGENIMQLYSIQDIYHKEIKNSK